MESVEGISTKQAKGELWSRLKNHFEVSKYEQIESSKLPDVKKWVGFVRREIQDNACRKNPVVFRAGKIPAIKASMKRMGRTNENYYPEIAARLKMRPFLSLTALSPKNLERVYQMVLRDAKRH